MKKKKRRPHTGFHIYDDGYIKWEVGMRFSLMNEFRDVVKLYGVNERRGDTFVIMIPNDVK